MKNLIRSLSFTLLLLLGLISVSAQEAQTILMTYIPNIQFAPMYVAIGADYFADAGIAEVNLEYLDEPTVIDLIAANQNQFGVVSGEQVILAASQNRPIVYVYEWFQAYPIGIVSSADLAISSAADLAGLRVGIPGRFGASYSGFTTLMQSAEMTEEDVDLREIGFAAPDVFCVGEVDAAVVYVNNEPLQIRNRAENGDCGEVTAISVLTVADSVDLVSNGLITNQELVESNPELVQAVVSAYDKGLRLTINNPVRAYLYSTAFIEGLPLTGDAYRYLEIMANLQDEFLATNPTREAISARRATMLTEIAGLGDPDMLVQFEVLLNSIELWDAEQLGYSDLASWENMQSTLMTLGLLENPVELENLFTNEFLPEAD